MVFMISLISISVSYVVPMSWQPDDAALISVPSCPSSQSPAITGDVRPTASPARTSMHLQHHNPLSMRS